MPKEKRPAKAPKTEKKAVKAVKTAGQAKAASPLAAELLYKPRHTAAKDPAAAQRAGEFCEGYKRFLDNAKTEREAAAEAEKLLLQAGYTTYVPGKKLEPGDKIYLVNRGKAVIAATVGKKALSDGVRLSASHIDSPRLDLKPNPLYEADEISYFKTHYYGGIRKYQWAAIPLSMHGMAVKKDGGTVDLRLGEEKGDAVFTITDLLPHLAAEQDKRTLAGGIKAEELNILAGSVPFEQGEENEAVKLETLRLLNKRYGITERDFTRAEIEFVPAFSARDVGFDQSMIGAYGQDDRVCAYTSLMAEIGAKAPQYTTVCVLADKEETGSDGVTGLNSDFLFHFIQDLAEDAGVSYRRVCAASKCLSADVNAAFDPTFTEPFEKRNACFLNRGVVLTKYTGARGKAATSDASAEFMGEVTLMLDAAGVCWQTGELGKADAGGGGTVAKYIANRNIEVVDVGVPVLSMHSPFEITAKLDVYHTYLAFCAFTQQA